MKTKDFFALCAVVLATACTQKQSVVTVPVSTIDIEQLNQTIDYDMDITGLSLADVYVLRNAPAARQGFPFKDAYLRGVYGTTTWYDSLTWKFDETVNFDSIEQKENEEWRDYYYRASEETGAIRFTPEEKAFMERLKQREEELRKLNFSVEQGMRVNVQNLLNAEQLKDSDALLYQQLARDGFAIVPAQHEQLFHVYEQNDYSCFPSFVTTDLFLQLYHMYFDCMLRELEENAMVWRMTKLSLSMYLAMHAQAENAGSEEIRRLAHHNAVFFAVAYELFTGATIAKGDELEETKSEVQNVMESVNRPTQYMADYQEVPFAYSLFRPRGHYTRNENLQRYFRGMMWLQSVPFGLDSHDELREAVVMAYALQESESDMQLYETVNTLLNYLMGQPDNLSIPQVQALVKKKGLLLAELLESDKEMAELKDALEEIGDKQTRIRPKHENTSHNKICLMPQRYQPDAEVLLEMVDYDSPTTKRATPQGLDFFAAMGVSAAEEILMDEGQKWSDFKPMLGKMKERMTQIDWTETMATQWMNTLKVLNDEDKSLKLPYFMGTPEWDKKNLNAVLASWAELKHDAILYAKQPFGAECGGGGLPEPVVKGYVEPNVGFWKKAIELLTNTRQLLDEQGVLTEKVTNATERMLDEAKFLLTISEKELAGQEPTDEEYDQLKCMGATFENISLDLVREENQNLMGWNDVQGADRNVALVADVYTANANNNPQKSILYAAVGPADEIFVIVEIGGYLYLTRGAVLSYREFTRPVDEQRLTDEEWQQKHLKNNPRMGVPEWMKRIIVPLKQAPVPNEEIFYSSGC